MYMMTQVLSIMIRHKIKRISYYSNFNPLCRFNHFGSGLPDNVILTGKPEPAEFLLFIWCVYICAYRCPIPFTLCFFFPCLYTLLLYNVLSNYPDSVNLKIFTSDTTAEFHSRYFDTIINKSITYSLIYPITGYR